MGGMDQHIKGMYNITDGDFMLELNALNDSFHICFHLINKKRKPLDEFLRVLDEEHIPYKVSDRMTRYLPKLMLP